MCAWLAKAKANILMGLLMRWLILTNYQANSLVIMSVKASRPARCTAIFNFVASLCLIYPPVFELVHKSISL